MEKFETALKQVDNPDFQTNGKVELYKAGVELLKDARHDFKTKKKLIKQILFFYPDDAILYHKMGALYEGKDAEKQLWWYKLSYNAKPDYFENLIALSRILFNKKLYRELVNLNKDNLFEQFLGDQEFLHYYFFSQKLSKLHKDILRCILQRVKDGSVVKCSTKEQMNLKFENYFYLGSIYFSLGDVMNGLKYTEKAYELSLKFNLYSYQLSTYMSVMCIYDYFLYDHKEYIRKARELESMYVVDALKRFNPKIGRSGTGKIRVGYVSSDFNLHVVSHFILPILRNHDLNRFEIYLYINLEEIHEYYRNIPAFKRLILNADDYIVAEIIQKDAIDILIDLNGNTLNNRLGVFAYNPAPIQMTYLGHPSSTFMKSIQYKIVDSITNPLDSIQYHTEELVRMKGCFLLYEHNIQYSPPITHRQSNRREIVFGSFNKESKNSEYILEIWGRILREVENSKIKIKLDSFDNAEARLAYYAEKMNVPADRIIIMTKLHDRAYMELFVDVDILLDTSPYSGTTTTCHSLYHSLPIITLYNKDYHCHNVSASLLINAGLERMVAKTPDEYVEIAKYMVENIDWFNEYKRGIRDKFLALMNPRRFMSEYEAMLGSLVQKHAR